MYREEGVREGRDARGKGRLNAGWVFGSLGLRGNGGGNREAELLEGCYRSWMELAREHGVKTIAFPAVSTGIYGYPKGPATEIAVRVCKEMAEGCGVERVEFCCFDEGTAVGYEALV